MRGDDTWILTYTGNQFWPLDPLPKDIHIRDIAHALSHVCRYTGHVLHFYSVGQHSVLASQYVQPEFALWALLHDASEAYISDVSRPLKRSGIMDGYLEAEAKLMRVICERFKLPPEMPAEVREADNRMLLTEKRDLLPPSPRRWGLEMGTLMPYDEKIVPWSPAVTKELFMQRFVELVKHPEEM